MLKDKENEIVPFKYEDKLQVCDILKKTKHLIKSSNNYCDYMQKYTYITQTTTFKLPEITSYPILKNNELIPLNKTTFEFFRPKSGDTNFLVGENSTNLLKGQIDVKDLPSRPYTQVHHRFTPSHPHINSKNNSSFHLEKEKETCLDIVKDEGWGEKTDEIILDKSVNFKKNLYVEGKENVGNLINFYSNDEKTDPSHLLKQNIQKINQVTKSFKSSETSKKNFKLKQYQIKDLSDLLNERIKTLKNNDYSTSFPSFYTEKIEKNSLVFCLNSFSINLRNLTNENADNTSINLDILIPFDYIPVLYSLDNSSLMSLIVLCCDYDENSNQIKFNHRKFYLFAVKNELYDEKNITLLKHYNSLRFHWIISDKMFEVTIKMPFVKVFLEKSRTSIQKTMEFDTIMNIYANNFINWTSFVKEYLESNKKYRETICKYNSKITKFLNEEEINLDIDTFKYFSENDTNFYFGFTLMNVNKFVTLNSFKLNCNTEIASLNYDFNFKHFRLIEEFSKHLSTDSFLKKLVVVSRKHPYLSLDLTNFNNIDNNYLKFMKNSIVDNENKQLKSKFSYKLTKPSLSFKYLEDDSIKTTEMELPTEIINKLVLEDLTSWYKVINENKEEMVRINETQIVKQETSEIKENLIKNSTNPKRKNTNNE